MTLIKSISGIRGTIGGKPGDSLTPPDIVKFSSAYASWIRKKTGKKAPLIIIGRDARISGDMVNRIITATLRGMGVNVIDLGLSTTPTVEVAVTGENADGGIIITASHNPVEWNALKLLNSSGEFLDAEDGEAIIQSADSGDFTYADVTELGWYKEDKTWNSRHIKMVIDEPLVNIKAIKQAGLKVAIDCINSSGSLVLPLLLEELGVTVADYVHCEPTGLFAHNPEPLPENLVDLGKSVVDNGADMGFAVDPDTDRLAIVCEDGTMFGEEYTLVAVADYVLSITPGPTVSNMSSTRALADITLLRGQSYYTSAVGEVNVVAEMKKCGAVIGGEGNGGVIYPALHYGRDALMGIGLFLSYYAEKKLKATELRDSLPSYYIAKKRVILSPEVNFEKLFAEICNHFPEAKQNFADGLRLDFPNSWVHVRRSNTEPIVRIYAEASNKGDAEELAEKVIWLVKKD